MPSIHEPKPLHHEPPRIVEPSPRPAKNPYQIDPNYQAREIDLSPLRRLPEDGSLTATLAERGSRYGAFSTHATITQGLKDIMKGSPKWRALADDQREALEMIQHKVGRILNGDPNYADSWIDIAGYAKLVADRLQP